MTVSEFVSAFTDETNLIWGGVVAVLSYLFGAHWPLFLLFLGLNVVDYIYGVAKAKATGTWSSAKGAKGAVKKVSYWVVIALAFGLSAVFVELGTVIGVRLDFLQLIGWFVLALYIINELTSILENMVALGVDVPEFLIRGLAAVKTAVDEAGDRVIPQEEEEDGEETPHNK